MGLFDRLVSLTLPAVPKPLVRYFSRPYIAGLNVDEAFEAVREMTREGALSTIDILGEFISTPDQARTNTSEYDDLLRRIHSERLPDANVSVKLTALGLSIDPALCLANMRRLIEVVVETARR